MFTGLVQAQGLVESARATGSETRFRIRPLGGGLAGGRELMVGESIAVNGACLTVEEPAGGGFTAYASAETLSRTNLGRLKQGSKVNLERAMALGDRLGGHMVSGHIDCQAKVLEKRPAGDSTKFRLGFPGEYGPLVVEKGSVALDGISLTVNGCGQDFLSVNIIPETMRVTTIGSWAPDTLVNMETDLIGKYVARMLAPWNQTEPGKGKGGGLSEEFLRKHGF